VASVTLNAIRKSYDPTTHVIKGVDLAIKDGEFLVLVGPSGCGKSTLLRLIAGLEEITAGELRIGERVVNEVPPRDRGIGMVFQSYALYPHMTVRENMAFGLKIRKTDQATIDARVHEASAILDLDAYLDRFPKQLSGGQRQRVAMGRAIVRQPDVFLFDEPLSNLDASLRTQMRVEIKKLHRRLGATMIYVTHDQVEAMTLADRIAVVQGGLIQQVGPPAELYERPINRFVAGFIGSPGMNFFAHGDVKDGAWCGQGFRLPLTQPSGTACVGVRPQHLKITREPIPAAHGQISGTIDVIEPMGWEAYLHILLAPGHTLIAHVEAPAIEGLQHGDPVTLEVTPDHLHAFSADGVRLG
jgi:multiple sugar transport system ATP-binding protein